MAGISIYEMKALLDFSLGGTTPTQPGQHAVGLSFGQPSSVSASEMATGSGGNRQTAIFFAAVTPAGSASNASSMSFGPFSAACTISGLQIWDTNGVTGGSFIWYGNLATARTLGQNDSLIFNVGALVVSLA